MQGLVCDLAFYKAEIQDGFLKLELQGGVFWDVLLLHTICSIKEVPSKYEFCVANKLMCSI